MKPEWLDRSLVIGPYYCLCLTEKSFEAELKRLELKRGDWPTFVKNETANATTHILEYRGKVACIVCVGDTSSRQPIEVAGLLVHEATHIWQAWLNRAGENNHGDEAEAYAVQWISQQLMWEYVRQTKRRRK